MSTTEIVALQAGDTPILPTVSKLGVHDFAEEHALVLDGTVPELDEKVAATSPEQSEPNVEQTAMGETLETEDGRVADVVDMPSVPPSPAAKEGVFRRLARKMSLQKVANSKESTQPVANDAVIEDSDADQETPADANESATALHEPRDDDQEVVADAADSEVIAPMVDLTPSKPKSGPFKQLKDKLKSRKNRDSATFSPATSMASIPASASAIPTSGTEAEIVPLQAQYQSQQLAEHIRKLIAALPAPDADSPFPKPPRLSQLPPPKCDKSGRPITPPSAIFLKDGDLIKKMRDPVIMNGKEDEPSVWSVLQEMGPDDGGSVNPGDDKDADEPRNDDDTGTSPLPAPHDIPHDILHDSSIMMYVPLEPTSNDKVELAQYQYVPLSEISYGSSDASGKKLQPSLQAAWKLQWPFHKKNKPSVTTPATPTEPTAPSDGDTPSKPTTPSPSAPVPGDKVVKVWLPSTTKMSIHALWWGYRIYLPPPVLAVLSDESIEAAKRAALITTALTWFFNNLPITVLPAPMQPALLLLRKIVPFVGYIGTFISWSWGQIKSYDVGYGVVLSATWLLPIALIPGTWQKYDFPEVTPGTPGTGTTPLPSTGDSPTPTPAPGTPDKTSPAVPADPPIAPPVTSPSSGSVTVGGMKLPQIPVEPMQNEMEEQIVQVENGEEKVTEADVEVEESTSTPVVEEDVSASAEGKQVKKSSTIKFKDQEETPSEQVTNKEDVVKANELSDPAGGKSADNEVKTEKMEKRKSRGIVGGLWNYFMGSR
ncbi:hypothetical protein VKT23_007392 [Stygiomarasmius scandens]|uniref:Uncharacterized protein n=1 Tax=Marasmiellus scandens TaxID=2682957 RepID=A0ABR1JMZ9_9AGAR